MPVPPVIQMYRYVMGSGGGLGNLLKASEEFQQTDDWVRYPTNSQTPTVNADSRPDPNGGTTADQVGLTANTSARLQQTVTLSASTEYTFSVYARAVSGTVDFRMRNVTLKDAEVKTATTTGPLTNGFTRFTYRFTTGAAGSYELALQNDTNATAKDVIFWGAMLNQGGTALDYEYAAPTTGGSAPAPAYAGFGDAYGGVTAYYSLRQFTEAETLNAIRVRRSSDDTEQDIGFDANGDLDTTALTTFVNEEYTIADEDFSSSTGWTLATGVSIADGVMSFLNATSSDTAYKNFGVPDAAGIKIRVSFTISNYSGSGAIQFKKYGIGVSFVETGNGAGTLRSGNGTYTEELTFSSVNTNSNWGLEVSGSFTGDIDNFEIVQITADGAVTTWYDQSGNGNDATNSTESEQPLIVSGGTLVEENSKAAIDFDGVNDVLTLPASIGTPFTGQGKAISSFSVSSIVSDNKTLWSITGTSNDDYYFSSHDGSNFKFFARGSGGTLKSSTSSSTFGAGQYLKADILPEEAASVQNGDMYIDGTQEVTSFDYATNTKTLDRGGGIGALVRGSVSGNFNGKHQEIIIFNSDQSTNRGTVTTGGGTGIEGNINTYFDIV